MSPDDGFRSALRKFSSAVSRATRRVYLHEKIFPGSCRSPCFLGRVVANFGNSATLQILASLVRPPLSFATRRARKDFGRPFASRSLPDGDDSQVRPVDTSHVARRRFPWESRISQREIDRLVRPSLGPRRCPFRRAFPHAFPLGEEMKCALLRFRKMRKPRVNGQYETDSAPRTTERPEIPDQLELRLSTRIRALFEANKHFPVDSVFTMKHARSRWRTTNKKTRGVLTAFFESDIPKYEESSPQILFFVGADTTGLSLDSYPVRTRVTQTARLSVRDFSRSVLFAKKKRNVDLHRSRARARTRKFVSAETCVLFCCRTL